MGIGVFQNCFNLEKIWLPGRITSVQKNCFYNCSLLDLISMPATVTSIGESAFYGCIELEESSGHVYFGGTSAQWKAITFGTGNGCLTRAGNIHMTPEELRISAEHFPDDEFRAYVAANIDADQSGWLTGEEIANTLTVYCGAIDAEFLTGIEHFTELEELEFEDNSVSGVDLSANTKLVYLECPSNQLGSLSLEALPGLYYLHCADNTLTELDVSHQKLEYLYCFDNPLASLDLSGQNILKTLYCYGTQMATLDLRACPLLLDCALSGTKTVTDNYTEYRIDSTHALRVGPDTELIIPGSIPVDEAHFPDEVFRAYVTAHFDLNTSGWLSQEEINEATGIVLDGGTGLASLLGIEYLTELTSLEVNNSPLLESIDISGNHKLMSVTFYNTGMTVLDVDGLPLVHLCCDNSPLEALTLGSHPNLRTLSCYGTELTEIDISGCPLLIEAYHGGKYFDASTSSDSYLNEAYQLAVNTGAVILTGIPEPFFFLPENLISIEDEAFSGIPAVAVVIPKNVTVISGNPFSGSEVNTVYGYAGSAAQALAEANGYTFVAIDDAWMAWH